MIKSALFSNMYSIDIVGNADTKFGRACQSFARERGLLNRINFIGYVNNASGLYDNYSILVVPSSSEGFGLVVLEALSKGLIVICSDIPSFRELFSGLPVVFFRVGDAQDLCSKIELVILGKIKFSKPEFCLGRFSQSTMVNNYFYS